MKLNAYLSMLIVLILFVPNVNAADWGRYANPSFVSSIPSRVLVAPPYQSLPRFVVFPQIVSTPDLIELQMIPLHQRARLNLPPMTSCSAKNDVKFEVPPGIGENRLRKQSR